MKKFLKQKAAIGAIGMAILYQVIMVALVLPAYSALPGNMDQLKVALINEDTQQGEAISKQIAENVPMNIDTKMTLQEAEDALEARELVLIIHIPADFSANLVNQAEKATMNFHTNQGASSMVNSLVAQVVGQMEDTIERQFQTAAVTGMLSEMQIPPEQAAQMASIALEKYDANMIVNNVPREGLHNSMGPIFLTMASNISALIGTLFVFNAWKAVRNKISKWKSFLSIQSLLVTISVLAPLGGLAIFFMLENYGTSVFFELWFSHALMIFAASQIYFMLAALLGIGGFGISVILLLTGVVANGGIIPREMMYSIYDWLSYVSPTYYALQADLSILHGGVEINSFMMSNLYLAIGALCITSIVFIFKKREFDGVEELTTAKN